MWPGPRVAGYNGGGLVFWLHEAGGCQRIEVRGNAAVARAELREVADMVFAQTYSGSWMLYHVHTVGRQRWLYS